MGRLQPRHREAYPRFDVQAASKACMDERPVCIFMDNEGRIVGIAVVTGFEDPYLTVQITVAAAGARCERAVLFEVQHAPNAFDQSRYVVFCPKCRGRKYQIVYAGEWACADCHGLLYRRQIVDKRILQWERLSELEELLRRGRPHGMHHRTYRQLESEMNGLRRVLKGLRLVASEKHGKVITSTWHRPDDVQELLVGFGYYLVDGVWHVDRHRS